MVFGEAGSNIIAKNIRKNSGDINFFLRGKKVVGVFGFCKVENFENIVNIL
jgi:hypothetical protein